MHLFGGGGGDAPNNQPSFQARNFIASISFRDFFSRNETTRLCRKLGSVASLKKGKLSDFFRR